LLYYFLKAWMNRYDDIVSTFNGAFTPLKVETGQQIYEAITSNYGILGTPGPQQLPYLPGLVCQRSVTSLLPVLLE
jgi:hypothetical protein